MGRGGSVPERQPFVATKLAAAEVTGKQGEAGATKAAQSGMMWSVRLGNFFLVVDQGRVAPSFA